MLFVNLIVSMMIVCNTFLNCYIFLSRLFLVIIIIIIFFMKRLGDRWVNINEIGLKRTIYTDYDV